MLGGPGAGKGTQSELLVQNFGFVHLSAGELLRSEVKKESKNGAMIQQLMKEGKIVPAEVTVELLKNAIEENNKQGKHLFLVDGFPRNEDNYTCWAKVMSDIADAKCCLFLECTEDVLRARLRHRAETSGRVDDNEESIIKRFRTYNEETLPICKKFEELGQLRRIDGSKTPEEVFAVVSKVIKELCKV